MKRTFTLALLLLCLAVTAVWGWNYSALARPLGRVLANDSRNDGIQASAHFASYLNPKTLIFDLRSVEAGKAPADVFRVLLQFAGRSAASIHAGCPRAQWHAKVPTRRCVRAAVGRRVLTQNPGYTMRTFPEHLKRPDGSPAFEQWTGGILGVLNEQLEDFAEYHKQWCAADLGTSP
jgi:hypothetical protein